MYEETTPCSAKLQCNDGQALPLRLSVHGRAVLHTLKQTVPGPQVLYHHLAKSVTHVHLQSETPLIRSLFFVFNKRMCDVPTSSIAFRWSVILKLENRVRTFLVLLLEVQESQTVWVVPVHNL